MLRVSLTPWRKRFAVMAGFPIFDPPPQQNGLKFVVVGLNKAPSAIFWLRLYVMTTILLGCDSQWPNATYRQCPIATNGDHDRNERNDQMTKWLNDQMTKWP